ncbi:MAG: hypothetical protein SPL58_05305 [Bacteroidaceae bacterium]|nr:hypothetical protein [Bacteroidaceae bacterium]
MGGTEMNEKNNHIIESRAEQLAERIDVSAVAAHPLSPLFHTL